MLGAHHSMGWKLVLTFMLSLMPAVVGLVLAVVWVARVLIIRIVARWFYGLAIEVKDITCSLSREGEGMLTPPRRVTLKLRNVVLHLPNAAKVLQLDAAKVLELNVGLERDAASPRLAYTLTVVVTALHVNYVTYDPKFNDTNMKRLLAAMQDDEHVDKRSPKFKVGDSGGAGGDGPPPRCKLVVYIVDAEIAILFSIRNAKTGDEVSNDTHTPCNFYPALAFPPNRP